MITNSYVTYIIVLFIMLGIAITVMIIVFSKNNIDQL